MQLKHPTTGREITIRAKPLLFIADGKAHKETSSAKGSAGNKCCISCRNICNVAPSRLADQTYLVHYALAKPNQFHLHTNASFLDMANALRASKSQLGKTAFGRLETAMGLTYEPQAWFYDTYLSGLISPVEGLCHDSMHCLCSSGGVAQYEVNAFVLYLETHTTWTRFALDEWCCEIVTPRDIRFKKDFFQKRVVRDASKIDTHIKCYA
eukprot:3507691-Karenia_brevis.AAC.1